MTATERSRSAAPASPKPLLVPYEAKHFEGVMALYAEVFGPAGTAQFRHRWRWAQEANLAPESTPKWVLLAGERVVGFLATIPLPYSVGGEEVLVHDSGDFMVHPDYRFHGIALMREYLKRCPNCVSLDDMPATIAVLKMLKARPVGEALGYVRLLDVRAVTRQDGRLRQVLALALSPLTAALSAYDLARAGLTGAEVLEVADFDERFDRFFAQSCTATAVTLKRDARYLRWRYGPASPHARRRIAVAPKGPGDIQGYVVACPSSSADRAGYVLDLHGASGLSTAVYQRLLLFACSALRKDGCWLARLHHFPSATTASAEVLKSVHFLPRSHSHVLFQRLGGPAQAALAADPERWSLSFGDTEASHFTGSSVLST